MHNIKHISNLAIVLTVVLSLAACGGSGRKVVTVDDSADYKSAKSLPPLIKPSRVLNEAPVATTSEPKPAPAVLESNQETVQESYVEPEVDVPQVQSREAEAPQTPVVQTEPEPEPEQHSSVSARVVRIETGQARLRMTADFDSAWDYLSSNLRGSDVTVFSRNKSAGLFAIGCGNIESAPAVIKRGRWSFINRGRTERAEYCSLLVVERRGTSHVSVLNRDGAEVLAEYSDPVFARILNN